MSKEEIIRVLAALLIGEGERFVHASSVQSFDLGSKLHLTATEDPPGWFVRVAQEGEAPDPGEPVHAVLLETTRP